MRCGTVEGCLLAGLVSKMRQATVLLVDNVASSASTAKWSETHHFSNTLVPSLVSWCAVSYLQMSAHALQPHAMCI